MPKKEKKKKKAAAVVEDATEIFNTKLAALEAVSLEPGQDPEELAFEFMLGALASLLSACSHALCIRCHSPFNSPLQLDLAAYCPRQPDIQLNGARDKCSAQSQQTLTHHLWMYPRQCC